MVDTKDAFSILKYRKKSRRLKVGSSLESPAHNRPTISNMKMLFVYLKMVKVDSPISAP